MTDYCDYCGADLSNRDHFINKAKHLLICPPCYRNLGGDPADDEVRDDTLILPPDSRGEFNRRLRTDDESEDAGC